MSGFAVLYSRPDGWWLAGEGFETADEAEAAAAHIRNRWIVPTDHPEVEAARALEAEYDARGEAS